VLSDEEFAFLWTQAGSIRREIGLAIRCLILLGGQRSRQLLRATWKDYDATAKLLALEDPKGKRAKAVPHVLPVSAQVALMLEDLRDLNGSGTFIFSTTAGVKAIHATSLPGVFAQIRAAWPVADGSPTPDFQGRDIRRSIETRLQALGVSREVRAQLMSHGRTSGVQQKHYERHAFIEEKRQALALLEGHLATVFNGRSDPLP
jgi:integrase